MNLNEWLASLAGTAVGQWTDADLARALRQSVRLDDVVPVWLMRAKPREVTEDELSWLEQIDPDFWRSRGPWRQQVAVLRCAPIHQGRLARLTAAPARLVVGADVVWLATSADTTIGSAPHCSLQIPSAAREHARVRWRDKEWLILALGQPIEVAGQRVLAETKLRTGDALVVGGTTVRFEECA